MLGVKNEKVWKLLRCKHIRTRRLLALKHPVPGSSSSCGVSAPNAVTRQELFHEGFQTFGMDAVLNALSEAHMMASQIDIIASVTSTGLALPGLSAMLMRRIPFKRDTQRTDIVGMGCNAGLSGHNDVAKSGQI